MKDIPAPDGVGVPTHAYRTYNRLHVPTGKTWVLFAEYASQLDLLERVNNWNRLGQGVWVYWV